MKIYFVRHGESLLNIENKEQGSEGSLSELGMKQAEFVAKRFDSIPVDIIVSSPHTRTKETAAIINQKLNKEILYSDFLIERVPPTEFIGVRNDDPKYLEIKKIMSNKRLVDPDWKYADEDNFTDLKNRALNALSYLKELDKETILAVSHAGILRVIAAVIIFGEELTYREYIKLFWSLKSINTGITLVTYENSEQSSHPGWKIVAWNDHAHL
jgi:broad specificity phosphatase PhoE